MCSLPRHRGFATPRVASAFRFGCRAAARLGAPIKIRQTRRHRVADDIYCAMKHIAVSITTLLLSAPSWAQTPAPSSAACASTTFDFAHRAASAFATVRGEDRERLYFHRQHPSRCATPDASGCTSKAYIVTGDRVAVGSRCGHWSYVEFVGDNSVTRGWVDSDRLETIDIPLDDDVPPSPGSAPSGHLAWKRCTLKSLSFEVIYPASWRIFYPSSSEGAANRPPIVLASCKELDSANGFLNPAVVVSAATDETSSLYVSVRRIDTTIYRGKTFDQIVQQRGGNVPIPYSVPAQLDGEPIAFLRNGILMTVHDGELYDIMMGQGIEPQVREQMLQSFRFLSH